MATTHFLSVLQAADLLGLQPRSVQKACILGTLTAIRVGRAYIITPEAVEAYRKDHKRTKERWSPKPHTRTTQLRTDPVPAPPATPVFTPNRSRPIVPLDKASVLARSQGKNIKPQSDPED